MGVEKSSLDGCMYDVLIGGRRIEESFFPRKFLVLEVAPATLDLAGAEIGTGVRHVPGVPTEGSVEWGKG